MSASIVMTETPGMSAEVRAAENKMLSALLPSARPGGTFMSASPYAAPPPGEILPNRRGVNMPIGNVAASLSNREGNKFTRDWLGGAGGADIEQNLGSCALDVRAAPYNSRLGADFRAVVPEYGAPVGGLTNWDVESPERTFGPLQQARAEWIPTTWSSKMNGLDYVSGNVGPRFATAKDGITSAPTPQYYAYGQVREGGDGFPSYPFGQRTAKPLIKAQMSAAQRKVGAGAALGGSMFQAGSLS